MSSAPIAPTTKSSIRCTRTPISPCGSITSCAIGNTPITACDPTSRSLTSLHWNSSPVGNSIGERQSVTNLLDEYTYCSTIHLPCYTLKPVPGGFLLRGPVFLESGPAPGRFRGKQVPNALEGDLSLNATSGRVTARA